MNIPPPMEWALLLPELLLAGLIGLLLLADLKFGARRPAALSALGALGLLAVLAAVLRQIPYAPLEILGGMYRIDGLALFFKVLFVLTGMVVLGISREAVPTFPAFKGEYPLLILTALLGMMLAASSAHFLMLFVSLELISIAFYVLTAYLRGETGSLEAGMKYLVLGSVASALLLYGIAFIYGATGSLSFAEIRGRLPVGAIPPGMVLGLLLMLAGALFKSAGVPFHLWVPDVYQGAPIPTAAFLSVGSKAAGFLVLLRVLHEIFLPWAELWTVLMAWVAGLTILYGNLGAIPQKNIKRLLGYSSIGHAGYLLIGIAAGNAMGATAVSFYLLSYLFTNLAVFGVVAAVHRHVRSDEIRAYAGLSRRAPLLAGVMFMGLLSLAGIPPLSGFFGKLMLLLSAMERAYLGLVAVGLAAVVISLYYYLLIVKTMYAEPAEDRAPIPVSGATRLMLLACAAAILGIGVWQGPFLQAAFAAVRALF